MDLKTIVLESYDRIVGLALADIARRRVHHQRARRRGMRRREPGPTAASWA
jgi:hypothetical protein